LDPKKLITTLKKIQPIKLHVMNKLLQATEGIEKEKNSIIDAYGKFAQPREIINCELKQHQREGFHWIRASHDQKCSCILADGIYILIKFTLDMGLGKTLQTIVR
jgi:SNF2 family DNA or RNA helicase